MVVTDIYKLLQSNQERTFPINKIETLFSEIGNPSIKSNSSNKIDCNLSVFDEITASDEQLGFSIKSLIGMFPNKEWSGIQDVDGGCLIVKEDGEIATFYIFRKAFLEYFRAYLFDKCFLDTASTSRHKFGVLYEENNITKLKLNLQVRIAKT